MFMFDGRAINQESKYLYVNNIYMCVWVCVCVNGKRLSKKHNLKIK